MNYLDKKFDFEQEEVTTIFDVSSLWSMYFGEFLLDEVPLRKGLKVLDVGCATGFPLFELAHRLGPTAHVTGVDIWETAIKRARLKKSIYDRTNVTLTLADASQMPYENDHFDLIVSNLGINNFSNPEQVCSECLRVLRPGGQLLLTTNLDGHMQEFYRVFEQVLTILDKTHLIPILQKQEAHRGTLKSVTDLLTNAGFSITKKIEKQLTYRYLDGTALLNHPLTIFGFLDGWRGILKGEDEQVIFEHLESALNELAEKEGELRLTIPMLLVEGEKK